MFWNTVTPLLREVLESMIADPAFQTFRLVGGTSLSLQLGHRQSVDIDMFTDADYGSVDFDFIDQYFRSKYPIASSNTVGNIGMGVS